jgi:hypothetical protein
VNDLEIDAELRLAVAEANAQAPEAEVNPAVPTIVVTVTPTIPTAIRPAVATVTNARLESPKAPVALHQAVEGWLDGDHRRRAEGDREVIAACYRQNARTLYLTSKAAMSPLSIAGRPGASSCCHNWRLTSFAGFQRGPAERRSIHSRADQTNDR